LREGGGLTKQAIVQRREGPKTKKEPKRKKKNGVPEEKTVTDEINTNNFMMKREKSLRKGKKKYSLNTHSRMGRGIIHWGERGSVNKP